MLSPDGLAEVHRRTHEGTARLLQHCDQLSAGELRQDLAAHGFGQPTVHEQLHHLITCEMYWIGVLRGHFAPGFELPAQEVFDFEPANFPAVADLEMLRGRIAASTAAWLAQQTAESLAAPAEFGVWGGALRTLLPAMVVLRIITHHHHHRGQAAAMTRLLGYPPPASPALDFPIVP